MSVLSLGMYSVSKAACLGHMVGGTRDQFGNGKGHGMEKLRPGWAEALGKQLAEVDKSTPKKESVLQPEVLEARRVGREKYWDDVRSGKRARKPRSAKP